jgi:hypothetical protein
MESNCLFDDEISSDKLPITCPYKVTDEAGLDPGVLGSAGTDLSKVSANFYKEYKAALALVPCDATSLRVFTTNDIKGKEYTIGIIFVYESSVEAIKNWLE